jgi:hypothetical protein
LSGDLLLKPDLGVWAFELEFPRKCMLEVSLRVKDWALGSEACQDGLYFLRGHGDSFL